MTEGENNENTNFPTSEPIARRAFEKFDHLFTTEYIRQIYDRNKQLWQLYDNDQFLAKADEWTHEIRYGAGDNQGLEKLREQSDQPNVTIVIPAHNEERKILQILQSIASQNYNKGIEVIVVDNNSNPDDKGTEFAEKCGAKVIKYNLPENSPDSYLSQIALARQKGIEAAKGKIIISTDGDAIAERGWVDVITKPLEEDQNITAVVGPIAHYGRSAKLGVAVSDISRQATRPIKVAQINRTDPEQISSTETKGVTPGANTAFRKADAMEIGGYNTHIYPGEDTNIGLRLHRLGKIKYVGKPDAAVRVSPRRYFIKSGVMEGLKNMVKRHAKAETMLYLDENGKPIIKR